ncbi:MAG TPA: 2-amino-4-hydroxy-6-hydroxymethyldihydropteridine diphosphokinase [Ignavibacteria bacterium]|jgi:dihydroneopterin aldolase/2-amino-4-hydroxy-6-hydroxymethyldihydropteridine diphosphokinase
MEKAVLGLGSNIGNRILFIRKAIKEISLIKGINIIGKSSLYETEPWGLKEQRNFVNCVIVCLCKLAPGELYEKIKKIEKKLGRDRKIHWGPRKIDVDILFYGKHIIKNKLKIPHPMIKERNFVLVPLNEIIPDFVHPVFKKRVSTLLLKSPDKSLVKKFVPRLLEEVRA